MPEFFQYFLLGILFINIFIPLLEKVNQIILTLLELIQNKLMIPIAKINQTINTINENKISKNHPIGFTTTFDVKESESYEDEDL